MITTQELTGQAPRVLIVDDEIHNQRLLETMLEADGFLLTTACSGEEALEIVGRDAPDLILLDIMMPGMDGFEVTAKVKENLSSRNIPVILLTALDDRATRIRGLSAGAEDFLTKPVDRAELRVRVRNLLRLKAYGDYHDQYSQLLEREVASRTDDLLRERDKAQNYLDTASAILLALDQDARVTLVNRHACAVLGWTADQLLGRNWFETCVSETLRDGRQSDFNAMLSGDVSVTVSAVRTSAGDERMIEWRNTVVRDETASVTGMFSSGTDVTERLQAVEALRRTEERMRFALENANIGIWDMDCETNAVRLSEITELQYDLKPGSFGGTLDAFVACVHPDDRAAVAQTLTDAMESGTDFSMLHRTMPGNAKVRRLRGSGRFKLDAQGNAVRGVGISEDITERHEMQRQNQQAQKMEAVGRLASGVAHDFNNLLCVVLGWTELALEDIAAEDPVREALTEVVKAGNAAARLTKQLLSFSRQQMTEATSFNPNELVVATELMLRRLIGENIRLVARTDPELGTIRMDKGQLDQVIMNLVVNARDAMPDGGTLTIETGNETVDATYARRHPEIALGDYILIAVSDTGSGMTEEVKSRIFEPFFTTKAEDKGTGLGLATSYGIVAQAGGRIEVSSEPGQGTSMRIYLPRDDTVSPTETRRMRKTPASGTETVLLVEDETPVRRVISQMLKRLGYAVQSAGDADEALQLLAAHGASVRLLLTDVVLADGVNGRILAEQALAIRPQLKVLLMSGYTNDPALLSATAEKNVALLPKPFSSEALGEKVRAILDAD